MRRSPFTLVAVGLAFGCGAEAPMGPDVVTPELAVVNRSANAADVAITKPFKARFYTEEVDLVPDGCGEGIVINTQEGMGTATHLGLITTRMVFCFNLNPGDPDNFGRYYFLPGPENGYFMAANGDQLWLTVSDGLVIFDPAVCGEYIACFHDPFLLTGGTGRFEGATGGGWIDSRTRPDGRTEHHWTGTVTLRPGS